MPVMSSAVAVQTVGELDAKLTGKPEEAAAERIRGLVRSSEPGLLKVMVWLADVMENDCVTGIAAK